MGNYVLGRFVQSEEEGEQVWCGELWCDGFIELALNISCFQISGQQYDDVRGDVRDGVTLETLIELSAELRGDVRGDVRCVGRGDVIVD